MVRRSKESKRSKSLRGGRRTAAERNEGAKCAGVEDPVTRDIIDPVNAIRLNSSKPGDPVFMQCYDVLLLKQLLNRPRNEWIHPYTRLPISQEQIAKIKKKLVKIGQPLLIQTSYISAEGWRIRPKDAGNRPSLKIEMDYSDYLDDGKSSLSEEDLNDLI